MTRVMAGCIEVLTSTYNVLHVLIYKISGAHIAKCDVVVSLGSTTWAIMHDIILYFFFLVLKTHTHTGTHTPVRTCNSRKDEQVLCDQFLASMWLRVK